MTLTITKTASSTVKRGTTDASTYLRRQRGKDVWYDAPRESKKRPGDTADMYHLPVDEDLCIVWSCECWDYVHVRQPIGETCKHQRALEARLLDEKQRRIASFRATHRLQFGADKTRNYWRVQVVNPQLGTDGKLYYDVVVSPKNKSKRHFIPMVPEERLKPLKWGKS